MFFSAGPSLILASLAVAAVIGWQRVADRPTARAIHAGLGLAVVGMSFGNLMAFTGTELVTDANGKVVKLLGKHTVGADDGTGGMPILARLGRRHAWLHGDRTRASLIGILAAGYAGLVALTAWQALRAQSLIHPDCATWLTLAAIIIAVALGIGLVHARANSAK
ncbi:hypothetical protein OG203_05625 [Nocardia sp. NBC_01499]|uniref:hypothetical protein n=1 Tax=Nocardia sp. NBC_01499 TaxID=2903597 RepID=UPI0038681FC7